ncbi:MULTISPECIES: hypothetical protein [Aerococcus]|uniref:hypothetical protein n=1 Tax=Aerococcus TaxID=1375 RepID=UPI0018A7C129|nr:MULTISPECIES: hypothetical protein [Aerococcus]MCY3067589.1 hypothetical protein [Aerococcus mictus]MCY3080876.1 hypothetical protein [Aerococcus mictus]MDK8485481.1 hypothetical protein [Aerococcus urinae]
MGDEEAKYIYDPKTIDSIYFYNGMNEPKLIASSIDEFESKIENQEFVLNEGWTIYGESEVDTEIYDELIENMKEYESGGLYREEVGWSYNIMVNPTIEDFQLVNKQFGLNENSYLDKLQDILPSSQDNKGNIEEAEDNIYWNYYDDDYEL